MCLGIFFGWGGDSSLERLEDADSSSLGLCRSGCGTNAMRRAGLIDTVLLLVLGFCSRLPCVGEIRRDIAVVLFADDVFLKVLQ